MARKPFARCRGKKPATHRVVRAARSAGMTSVRRRQPMLGQRLGPAPEVGAQRGRETDVVERVPKLNQPEFAALFVKQQRRPGVRLQMRMPLAVIQQPAAGLDHEVGHPQRDTIEAVTDACKQQHKPEPLQVAQRQTEQPRLVADRE